MLRKFGIDMCYKPGDKDYHEDFLAEIYKNQKFCMQWPTSPAKH